MQRTHTYLLKICRFNSIEIVQDSAPGRFSALVLVDTPKPDMIAGMEMIGETAGDPSVPKIELDHHIGSDSIYYGDEGLRLVYEASSTCEIIGHLAMKIEGDEALKARYDIEDLLSRNLVLAVISGMIGDSQMGRFLKSRRERWFYAKFSSIFENLLERKTLAGSGNFSSKEQVFEALAALSDDEEACYGIMSRGVETIGGVRFAALDAESSRKVFSTYGNETVITVSKALVDALAEGSGCLGLVGFYDDPGQSPFVQFRLRRSQSFTSLDLREALSRLEIANGGGHPGAVGFRIEREAVPDIAAAVRKFAEALNAMAAEGNANSAP